MGSIQKVLIQKLLQSMNWNTLSLEVLVRKLIFFVFFSGPRMLHFRTLDSTIFNPKNSKKNISVIFLAKSWMVTPPKIKKKYQLPFDIFLGKLYFCHFSMILDMIFCRATPFRDVTGLSNPNRWSDFDEFFFKSQKFY